MPRYVELIGRLDGHDLGTGFGTRPSGEVADAVDDPRHGLGPVLDVDFPEDARVLEDDSIGLPVEVRKAVTDHHEEVGLLDYRHDVLSLADRLIPGVLDRMRAATVERRRYEASRRVRLF